ncbi:MAG: hypothetical protein AAF235_02210 [Planctomycetota bacterium]
MDKDAELIAYLAEHDAWCRACGYQLRSLKSAHCPECSDPLSLVNIAHEQPHIESRKFSVALLIGAMAIVLVPIAFLVVLATLLSLMA